MISLEQVQLLEARVSKAIEYVKRITSEKEELVSQRNELNTKLESYQKRIDELEVLVMRFKEDQGRIEDGILAALDRLSQFEEAFENSLKDKGTVKKTAAKTAAKTQEKPAEPASKEIFFEIPEEETTKETEPVDDDLSSEGELDIF
jgi:FtsZ-binding cell division protein ZapB